MSKPNNTKRLMATKAAKSWQDDWRDTQGGFNPDVFEDVDDATRQKLLDYQIGPPVHMGSKLNARNAWQVGHWSDGGNYGPTGSSKMNELWFHRQLKDE